VLAARLEALEQKIGQLEAALAARPDMPAAAPARPDKTVKPAAPAKKPAPRSR
jgi:BMFP domain-containing protein YqiC